MTPEQKAEMLIEFEKWVNTNDWEARDFAWQGFQACYIPKPDIEKVAKAIYDVSEDSWVWDSHTETTDYDNLCDAFKDKERSKAQAAINVIFNKE